MAGLSMGLLVKRQIPVRSKASYVILSKAPVKV